MESMEDNEGEEGTEENGAIIISENNVVEVKERSAYEAKETEKVWGSISNWGGGGNIIKTFLMHVSYSIMYYQYMYPPSPRPPP